MSHSWIVAAMMVFCVLNLGGGTGQDYLMVNRVRFLDRTGFERPVESLRVLLPQGVDGRWQERKAGAAK